MRGIREAALLLVMLAVSTPLSAASKAELEARIEQLERRLDSRSLMDMLNQITSLQDQIQQLRGDIEVQNHKLENLQKHQRDLYLDIDRRLHRLETGGVENEPAPPLSGAQGGAAPPTSGVMAPMTEPVVTAPEAAPTLNPADERKALYTTIHALEQDLEKAEKKRNAEWETYRAERAAKAEAERTEKLKRFA